MTMKKVVGYSLYVNETYFETYSSLEQAHQMSVQYGAFTTVEVLPMFRTFNTQNTKGTNHVKS